MAKTIDNPAQKKRQQTIILVVLGVVLLAVLVVQLPKLRGGSSSPSSSATPATATSEDGLTPSAATTVATTTAGSTTATTPVPAGVPRAVLVGVTVGGGALLKPGEGQLRAFTLFTQKDPFVQRLPQEPVATATASPPAAAAGSSGSGKGGGSTAVPTPEPLVDATISVNGEPEAVTVDQPFPEKDPLFVLRSLKAKSAKIGVAGGAFTDSEAITLQMGKSLTLVNTATGARYVVKLLYTGSVPEEVESFTKKAPAEPKK